MAPRFGPMTTWIHAWVRAFRDWTIGMMVPFFRSGNVGTGYEILLPENLFCASYPDSCQQENFSV
jgi:hypothetical protein